MAEFYTRPGKFRDPNFEDAELAFMNAKVNTEGLSATAESKAGLEIERTFVFQSAGPSQTPIRLAISRDFGRKIQRLRKLCKVFVP